ncbi:MAG: FkbM family methyltransferase [Bacteroidetes bacterium]|nr:FkbM family methyltransferase [Bacteroidota bacterium]
MKEAMKQALKLFLGDYFVYRIMDFKTKWLPSNQQKIKIKQEIEEIGKRKLFYGTFIKKNDLCFDVGANVGNRIIPLLELGAKVVAVEPQESCFKILKLKFGEKIEIVTKGLGERECVQNFHISDASIISSFSEEWIDSVKNDRFKQHNWDKVVKVEMTTLDRLIEKYSVPVFIKIDVEGYELNVLKGLTKPVKMISFEYTVPEQTNKVVECIEQIEKNDENIECNYSTGESMVLALKEWQSVEKIKKHIITKEFIDTGFGDVYVRNKN